MFSYDQQGVGNSIAHSVNGSLITFFLMTNSEWVTLHIPWKAVSSHLFPWPTASEWHCTFYERQSHYIFFYDQQEVSDIIAHLMKGSLITSFPVMSNRLWVTLHILWKAVSLSHLFLWKQRVSDILHSVKDSLMTSFPKPTVSEWHCIFYEGQSHHIFFYDQQEVRNITHFMKGSLITFFPVMTNRWWVTLHILWTVVSWHLFIWLTGSKWHCTYYERQSHHFFSYN